MKEGWTNRDGRLPVNPSGGLKAKGHPIGATGVSMHALSAMQLCGEAGGIQVKDATLGGVFNMGGAAVANYVASSNASSRRLFPRPACGERWRAKRDGEGLRPGKLDRI